MRKIQVRAHDGAAVLGMEPYQHFPLHCPLLLLKSGQLITNQILKFCYSYDK